MVLSFRLYCLWQPFNQLRSQCRRSCTCSSKRFGSFGKLYTKSNTGLAREKFSKQYTCGTSLIIGNHPQQELIDRYATPKERDRMYSFLITSALMKHASKQSLNLEEFFSDLKSYDKSKHEKIWKHQFISYFISLATEIYTNTENPLNNTDIFLTIINGGYRAYHAT
jgi:hypothetical protein